MRKASTLLVSFILLVSFSTALDARIDESDSGQSTVDVVLKPANNYSYTANYSSTASTGDIKNREWTLVGTDQTDSGLSAQFEFDRGMDDPENVKLVVSDGNTAEDFQISQPIKDIPNASISASSVEVDAGESVEFTSRVTNEFENDSLGYSWNWDGEGEMGDGTSGFTHTFDSSGTYEISLNVSDSTESYTTDPITVDVASAGGDGPSGGGGGGGGFTLPQQENDTEEDDNKTEDLAGDNKQETSERNDSSSMDRGPREVSINPGNGVAQVTINKSGGTGSINVEVDPASGKSSVKNIRISSEASGEVSVSMRDVGREKPPQVPEEASKEVYSYQEINTSINDSEVDLAEIDFSVNKSWINERNRSREDVVMKRFSNGSWESLDTSYINSTDDEFNFEASSEGFSYYAVALEDSEIKKDGTPLLKEQLSSQQSNRVFYIVAIILMAIMAFVGYWKREEINDRLN